MKYIHPDMTTLPDGAEQVTIHAWVEEPLVEQWLAEIGETPWKILVEEADQFCFDAGGAVQRDEPQLRHCFGDWTLTVLLRHADVLKRQCRTNVREGGVGGKLGPHLFLNGYWNKAILAMESGRLLSEWIDGELDGRIGEADQLWASHCEVMGKVGVRVPPRIL